MVKVLILLVGTLILAAGSSFAHEGEEHGYHHHDAQMAKLHKMMPRYAKAQSSIEAALEKGDTAAVAKETEHILSTTADLKQCKPHKRLNELKDFQAMAAGFEKDVKSTDHFVRKGDLSGAKTFFAKAQQWCMSCHAKFRD